MSFSELCIKHLGESGCFKKCFIKMIKQRDWALGAMTLVRVLPHHVPEGNQYALYREVEKIKGAERCHQTHGQGSKKGRCQHEALKRVLGSPTQQWAVTAVLTSPRMGKVAGGVRGSGAKGPHQPRALPLPI